jgi:hypothetical protein
LLVGKIKVDKQIPLNPKLKLNILLL